MTELELLGITEHDLEQFWIEFCKDNGYEDSFFEDNFDEALERLLTLED